MRKEEGRVDGVVFRSGIVPREGGILSVWLSTMIYGIIASKPAISGCVWFKASAVVGAILALPFTGLALRSTPGFSRLKFVAPVSLLFLPVIYYTWPTSIYYVVSVLVLLYGSIVSRGLSLILVGGPLVAGIGGGLALTTMDPVLSLLPITYSITTVSLAAARVTGEYDRVVPPIVLGGIGVLVSAAVLLDKCMVASGLLVVDLLLRLAMYPLGVYDRLSLKQYGFHESIRSLIILSVVAYCV